MTPICYAKGQSYIMKNKALLDCCLSEKVLKKNLSFGMSSLFVFPVFFSIAFKSITSFKKDYFLNNNYVGDEKTLAVVSHI